MIPSPLDVRPLLEGRGLCFSRNEELIFGPLDFRLGPAEALQVLGGNGTGKTTLLRVLAGLLPTGTGEVRFDGCLINQDHLARGCVYLGHLPGHKGELSALENLSFTAAMQNSRVSPEQALAKVGLAGFEDSLARRLSAGQNKRLALARLSLSPARLWLLDEPYANLDLAGIGLVNDLISDHVARQGSVLLTTHGAYAAPPVPVRTLELGS